MTKADSEASDIAFRRNLAGGIFAVFVAGAGFAQAANGPLWLKLTFAGIAFAGAIVAALFLLRERRARISEAADNTRKITRIRSAVRLRISHDRDAGCVSVTNYGTHLVRNIEINAIPNDEMWHPSTHGQLPILLKGTSSAVAITAPIVGGWFHARIAELDPDRGLSIVSYREDNQSYDSIDFDVFWIDHDGLRRKAQVSTSLRLVTGDLEMNYRDQV